MERQKDTIEPWKRTGVSSGSGMMILSPTDMISDSGLITTIEQKGTTDSVWLAPPREKNYNISKNIFPTLCPHSRNLQLQIEDGLDSATIQLLTNNKLLI